MSNPVVTSGGLTIVLTSPEAAQAIDDPMIDGLLDTMRAEQAVAFEVSGHPALLLSCEQVEIMRHPSNPMVYLIALGDEDEVLWATNKTTTDAWSDLGMHLELTAGALKVFDLLGRDHQTIGDLPPGTYRLLEYRGGDAWICMLAEAGFWDRLT